MTTDQFINSIKKLNIETMSPIEGLVELMRLRREAHNLINPSPVSPDAQDFATEAEYDAALAKYEAGR